MKLSILYFNIFFFILNAFFLIKKNNFEYYKKYFKNSDYFIILFLSSTYKEISSYLNNKYNHYNILLNNKYEKNELNQTKKIIKLGCLDHYNKLSHQMWLKKRLNDKFIIIFDDENPDYVIFNVFGQKHFDKKYNSAIKIAFYTENKIPDLNEVDYAIGHYHINYLDRFFKYSIFLWFNHKYIHSIRDNILKSSKRKKFCAALITKATLKGKDLFRLEFINELNKYKTIDMGGKYKNNIGRNITNKREFLSSYKFSIAMENSNGDGYISEKIIDAFIAGTIPIYYGDYMVDEYINPKSYILIKGKKDIKNKIKYIEKIDNDEKLYRNILREKVIIDNNYSDKIENELKLFLTNIFQQEKIKAFRRYN